MSFDPCASPEEADAVARCGVHEGASVAGDVSTGAGERAPASPAGCSPVPVEPLIELVEVPCLGITGLETSQLGDPIPGAVLALDWLEVGGLVRWDYENGPIQRAEVLGVQRQAAQRNEPQLHRLAGRDVLVFPSGFGAGRQARMSVRIELPGIRIGLSFRESEVRTNANFYMNISGEACVIAGALACRRMVHEIIVALGGELVDEWVKRIDICLDLPEYDIRTWIIPAYKRGYFKGGHKRLDLHGSMDGEHGFSVKSKACDLKFYDKLLETYTKKPELYRLAMEQNRWGGGKPTAAIRIEFSIRKTWLNQWVLSTVEDVLSAIWFIVCQLTRFEPQPFFCFTDGPVDRKNQHQGRVGIHPEWIKIVQTMLALAGTPSEPLRRVDRSKVKSKKACVSALGYLSSAAAECGAELASVEDAAAFLKQLASQNGIADAYVAKKWQKKARVKGTVDEPTAFPFGQNAEGGAA